jgi:hypothetical protein
LEELGQSNVAVKEYLALVESGKVNTEVAKKANRRLLMIGSIYEKNKDLTDYSKSNAEKLGDTEVVKAVEDGSKLILDSVIVEKLLKGEVKDAPPEMAKEFEELKKELQTIKAVEKEERKEVTEQIETKVADIRKKEIEVPEPTNLSFLILLTDGRELKGKVLEFEDEKIHILSGVFSSDLPFTVIKDIKIYESATFNEPPIKVISKKNKVYQCFKITKIDDTFTLKLLKDETKLDIDEIKKITIR